MAQRSRQVALTLLLLLVPFVAEAQACPKYGDELVFLLREGCPAPFTGQLFTNDAAIRLGQRAERAEFKVTLLERELQVQRQVFNGWLTEQRRILEEARAQEREVSLNLMKEADEEIRRLRNPPVWKQGWFTFGSGVVITLVGVVALLLIPSG